METPLHMFLHWERETPDRIFLRQPVDGKIREISYAEAGRQARIMARRILEFGLKPGDRVAILSKNCAHWILADLAIVFSGMVSVPIYPTLSATGIAPLIANSGSKLIFVGKLDDYASQKAGIPEEVIRVSFSWYGINEAAHWDELIRGGKLLTDPANPAPEALMTIMYSSGTTGSPKGVMLTHGSFGWVGNRICEAFALSGHQQLFSYLPLSHIAERGLLYMIALRTGSTIAFAESLTTFAADLEATQPTVFGGVPRIFAKFQEGVFKKFSPRQLKSLIAIPLLGGLLKNVLRQKLGLAKAGLIACGASPIPVELLRWFKSLGISIVEVYGMTENCSYSHANYKGVRLGSVGHSLPEVETRITEEGEIHIRHPHLMLGYYNDPETTRQCFTEDGFFKTGDKGFVDADGFLFITGRIKEQFKTEKGKFIAPAPIEMDILSDPAIEQALVVGMGIPQPLALVVLSESGKSLPTAELHTLLTTQLEAVNSRLEKHEQLAKMVILREAWTQENNLMTPTLKIKRAEVDALFKSRYHEWYQAKGVILQE